MAVTIHDVEHIANLAKLKFSDKEKEKLQVELNKVLDYIDTLNEIPNLDKVEPLENINDTENVFREDVPEKCLAKEEALKNAPDKTENFFKVPKVIDK
ncbi:MAG: Asp-tRNA(Asn)/Glu-tRNA(Gln) amidotransferase subunit GatC [Chlorobi bacterium]|nr:Asp-tRNA(Asn)/Glu-tRNA(Gln) amidotransferase subunit GatC [Chlorobiota bacterium]MCI0715229.1 Asp-tRNA(Asn)/Glu-tRNA(Gln) amidotransferase subunit GatC [Chlorobiota bacterium]